MRSTEAFPSDPARLDPALLCEITGAVSRAAADAPPCVFGIELGDETPHDQPRFELKLRPAVDPAAALLCWQAPATWDAIGIATSGRVHRMGAACRTAQTASITHAVARSGASVTILDALEGTPTPDVLESAEPVSGLTSDACRRALGLATAPPLDDVRAAVALLWLDAIVAAATRQPGLEEAACWHLHPALAVAAPGAPSTVAARCTAALEGIDWSWLRRHVAAGAVLTRVPPDVAAWCDDGAFSRQLVASVPDRHDLFPALRQLVPAHDLLRVLDALDALLE